MELGASSESWASLPPARPFSGTSPRKEPCRSRACGFRLSWGSCSHEHYYAGCPSPATRPLSETRAGRGSPNPRQCRPQGSCPSRRFRLARGSHEVFWTPPFAVAPDASRPCSMPLAFLERPFRAFPSREAVPALAGLLLPCGFAFDRRRRSALGRFTIAFANLSQPVARRAHPEVDRDSWARTLVPCVR